MNALRGYSLCPITTRRYSIKVFEPDLPAKLLGVADDSNQERDHGAQYRVVAKRSRESLVCDTSVISQAMPNYSKRRFFKAQNCLRLLRVWVSRLAI
jgi:hypothetical protein